MNDAYFKKLYAADELIFVCYVEGGFFGASKDQKWTIFNSLPMIHCYFFP